ncbi:6,7-dimethyl-8-ribityllumazine synthase, partial [Microbacterium gubbeenense]
MSGSGQPRQGGVDATGIRVVVVAGTWHEEISDALLAGAERMLEQSGADYRVVRVAGAFELPVVSKVALEKGADAVVALGIIIRGGTPHFEY